MIFVLHGDDQTASYARLAKLTEQFLNYQKVNLAKEQLPDLISHLSSVSFLNENKLIIGEGMLSPLKKIPKEISAKLPQGLEIVFWEKNLLSPAKVNSLSKFAKIEIFKNKSRIYEFLDGLSSQPKKSLVQISQLEEDENLLWNLQNRCLLLILTKMNLTQIQAGKITKRPIFDWQWAKIRSQASAFRLETLKSLLTSSLKVDFLIKSGRTNLDANELVSMMLLKYLN